MSGAKGGNQGHADAHTPPGAADGEADAALPGGDPLDLLAGLPDLDATDLLALAAEPALTARRARGRPKDALNRKNNDMIAYLASMGHRDPWVTLSLIQTADTMKLAMALRVPMQEKGKVKHDGKGRVLYNPPDPQFVLALQERAATTLMKYHHAQKPQQLELPQAGLRPLMVFGGDVTMQVVASGDGFMSAGVPVEKFNEINGDAVRESEALSHDALPAPDSAGKSGA